MAALPLETGASVLDYCAGGGGKALAVAAIHEGAIAAHDISAARLDQIIPRARRAGVQISMLEPRKIKSLHDGIILDVPCSGSGAWRRQPEAKWRLTAERLAELTTLQRQLLSEAAQHLNPKGWIAYMTCSLLACENHDPVAQFCSEAHTFSVEHQQNLTPLEGTDGFSLTVLRRS